MLSRVLVVAGYLALRSSAEALASTQSLYGQCGGISYTGPTICPKTAICYNDGTNPWYSQCVETPWDHPSTTIKTTTKVTTVPVTTTSTTPTPTITTIITTLPPRTTTTTLPGRTTTVTLKPDDPFTEDKKHSSPTAPAQLNSDSESGSSDPSNKERRQTGPGTTLQAGWYWIRAVVQPNYHKYLQTKPANAPGTAILETYRTAGQFAVKEGQLVANTGTASAPLYLNVEKPADFTQRKLATWFNTTKNAFGTFVFQGDALTWSTPEVKRQNLAAWLVCEKQALYINTGAYAYQTPAGCADQTIHYYNDAHANE